MKYIAFLRAINSGANPSQKMESLRKIFEKLGFRKVQSIIASGNILFDSNEKNIDKLEKKIEDSLFKETGIETPTIVWSIEDLQKFIDAKPFKSMKIDAKHKPHVTFIKDDHKTESFVVDMETMRTPDVMRDLEKKYGKNITTRTLLTVERVIKKALEN